MLSARVLNYNRETLVGSIFAGSRVHPGSMFVRTSNFRGISQGVEVSDQIEVRSKTHILRLTPLKTRCVRMRRVE